MPSPKPSDFPLLLEVFWDELTLGIISRAEIIKWADEIIMLEGEPDYFFIELSMCRDVNDMTSLIGHKFHASESPVPSRVLMALVHQQLNNQFIDVEKCMRILHTINYREKLWSVEQSNLFELDEYFEMSLYNKDNYQAIQLNEDILKFTLYYKDFELGNYIEWQEINSRVEEVLMPEQAKWDAVIASYNNKQAFN